MSNSTTPDNISSAAHSTSNASPESSLPFLDSIRETDHELWAAFGKLSALPWTAGCLEPKVKEFVGIAINASTSHLYEPALRTHLRNALSLGASAMEVLEVLELTSVLGVHTCTMAMPILADELGREPDAAELSEREHVIRERFRHGRRMWPSFFDDMVRLDADYVDAYRVYSTVPWRRGTLPPKVREFIYLAIDANTTHLYETGTRLHIQNALRAGATPKEILEVLRLSVLVGIHACTMALPILFDEVERAGHHND